MDFGAYSSTTWRIQRVKDIVREMQKQGITNPIMIAAGIAVAIKESYALELGPEDCWHTTQDLSRIRTFFSRLKDKSDGFIRDLQRKGCVAFFNYVYDNTAGNGTGDGYKYRGRGYIGVTFKGNYDALGKEMGVDLVRNPELLEKSEYAAKATAIYFRRGLNKHKTLVKSYLGTTDYNKTNNLVAATGLMAHLVAGPGFSKTSNTVVRGTTAAQKYSDKMLANIKGLSDLLTNPGGGAGILPVLFFAVIAGVGIYFIAR